MILLNLFLSKNDGVILVFLPGYSLFSFECELRIYAAQARIEIQEKLPSCRSDKWVIGSVVNRSCNAIN